MSTEHAVHLAQWRDRLQDATDGALSPAEAEQLRFHVAGCALCTREQQRLLAVDAQLRAQFAEIKSLTVDFDQRLMQRIATLEQDRIAAAKQREQQEHAARLARVRSTWREFSRFHLGNVVGVVATMAATVTAMTALRPTMWLEMNQRLLQVASNVPQSFGLSSLPIAIIASSIVVAAAAMWYLKSNDLNLR